MSLSNDKREEDAEMATIATDFVGHPDWCDPAECTANEWLSYHRSAYRRISTPAGAVEISAQLRCNAYDPISEAPVSVKLTMVHPDGRDVESYHLDASTLVQLHKLFGELLSVVDQ